MLNYISTQNTFFQALLAFGGKRCEVFVFVEKW